MIKPIRNETKG